MFDSLADRIREDEHKEVSQTERVVRYLVIALVSFLVFGGVYFVIQHLE